MGLFEHFPYTNFHEMNLDWILDTLKQLDESVTKFISINSIKYANPIQWDITNQYEKNTVVLDKHGNAYLSVQTVPAGISLDRTEYWTVIGNFSELWASVKAAITPNDEGHDETASADRAVGDWVWVNDVLYLITKTMSAGDKYIDGSNCQNTNIMTLYNNLRMSLNSATVNLQKSIIAEATARQEADTALNGKITDEETARKEADTTLDDKITAEATARQEADARLKDDLKAAENIVFFEKYGAVGDGVTDDTKAIKAAVADAENTGKILASLAKTYFVTDTIAIDCHKVKNVNITGTIKASFKDRTILKLYTSEPDGVTNAVINCKVDGSNGYGGYQFPAEDEGFNFPIFAMKGIEILDINRSVINCAARNCTAGIVLTNSSAHGVVFNTINIGDVYNCVVSLSLEPANNGWVNSNTFVGGGFQIDSAYSAYNKRTVTIRLLKETRTCNSNTFIAPSFETGGLPLLFKDASYNTVRMCRNENNTDYIAKFDGNSQLNIIEVLYGLLMPSTLGDGAPNNQIITVPYNSFCDAICIKRWDFDRNKCFNVGKRGSAESSTIVDGVDYVDASNIFSGATYWDCSITDTGLIISGNDCVGCLIDTHYIKKFYISAGDEAKILIIPMNDSKVAIEEEPVGPTFREYWKVSGITAYTGSPLKNGDTAPLNVTENTKYVFIGFANKVKTFSIFAVPYNPQGAIGNTVNIIKITSGIGSRKIPSAEITSKCDTGTMLPACDPAGTALAYICTDGSAQTWTAINKPS